MRLTEEFRRWQRYRQVLRELQEYRPGELSELGIAEADFGRVALHEARSGRRAA